MLSASLANEWRTFSTTNLACQKFRLDECSGWTPDQKLTRLIMSEANLARFEADPDRFVKHFLTQDECWVHYFEPETKRQSMQWNHLTSPAPKKTKVVSSAGKVMVSVFWDAKGIAFIDYLQ